MKFSQRNGKNSKGSNILFVPVNFSKCLCIAMLPCLNGYLQLRNVSVDSSFDSLLTVSKDAGYLIKLQIHLTGQLR